MALEIASGFIGNLARPTGVVASGVHVRPKVRPESVSPVGFSRDAQAVQAAGRIKGEMASVARGKATAELGIKFAKSASDGVKEIRDNLARMEVLAQAANSTVEVLDEDDVSVDLAQSVVERALYQVEFDALRTEIDAIVDRTTFNDTKLLDGAGGASQSFSFTVGGGTSSGDAITITLNSANVAQLDSGLASADISTESGSTSAETTVEAAQNALNDIRGTILGVQGRFDAAVRNGDITGSFLKVEVDQRLEFKATEDAGRALAGNVAESNGVVLQGFQQLAQRNAQITLLASAPGVFAVAENDGSSVTEPDAETTGDLVGANTVGGRTDSANAGRTASASYGSDGSITTTGSTTSVDIEA
ncbi:MAG: hypothetical protein V3T02_01395 [Alphaproteobacteria bacterium]